MCLIRILNKNAKRFIQFTLFFKPKKVHKEDISTLHKNGKYFWFVYFLLSNLKDIVISSSCNCKIPVLWSVYIYWKLFNSVILLEYLIFYIYLGYP